MEGEGFGLGNSVFFVIKHIIIIHFFLNFLLGASKETYTGAIIGGVLGGLLFLLLIGVAVLWFFKLRKKGSEEIGSVD